MRIILNPPEWTATEILTFPGSADGPWRRSVDPSTLTPGPSPGFAGEGRKSGDSSPAKPSEVAAVRIGTVRYPRIVPKDAASAEALKKRTLTNLYNERPAWLANAHRKLDEAVFAAYGWPPSLSDDELLAKLLELNLERAGSAAM